MGGEGDLVVLEIGDGYVHLGHEVPDLPGVGRLRVYHLWCGGGGGDDGALALERGGIGGFIVGGRGVD